MEDYSLKMADLINGLQIAIVVALGAMLAEIAALVVVGVVAAPETEGLSLPVVAGAAGPVLMRYAPIFVALFAAWFLALELQRQGIDSVQELVDTVAEKLREIQVGDDKSDEGEQPKPTPVPRPYPGPGQQPDTDDDDDDKKSLYIYEKDGWSPEQIAEAKQKVADLDELAVAGDLVKSLSVRGSHVRDRFRAANPGVNIDGKDIDHTHELQLGGKDETKNMKPLDPSVNRSIGAQIQGQIADDTVDKTHYDHVYYIDPDDYPPGTKFPVPEGSEFGPE